MDIWNILYLNLHPVVTASCVPGWCSIGTERRQQDETGQVGLRVGGGAPLTALDGVWAPERYNALIGISGGKHVYKGVLSNYQV